MLKPFRGLYLDEVIKNGKTFVKIRVGDNQFETVAEAKDPIVAEGIAREILTIFKAKRNIQSLALSIVPQILPDSLEELELPQTRGRKKKASPKPRKLKLEDPKEDDVSSDIVETASVDLKRSVG